MAPGRWREGMGVLGALVIAVITTAVVASSPRAELLFRDADSLIVALFTRSLFEGDALDWAMSPVLFVPETFVFAVLWFLGRLAGLGPNGVLALSAVVNMLALYGALRVASGRRSALPLLALGMFSLLVMSETSSSRDALELASLLLTTTYYSATVVGTLLAVGLVRRILDSDAPAPWLTVALGTVTLVSVLSNPLFGAWAVAPLGLLLAFLLFSRALRSRALPALFALALGSAGGLLGRIPLSAWIANTGAGYARPERWSAALSYYSGLFLERLQTPFGVLGTLLLIALLALSVWESRRASSPGFRLIATFGWLSPVIALFGGIALGTEAARYLAPIFFAPLLGIIALQQQREPRTAPRFFVPVVLGSLAVATVITIPVLVSTVPQPNADLRCVTSWVAASGRTGAGQFWTVRLPKLHLEHPEHLVQVDHQLNGYAWLVNRTDFAVGEVSFLVQDSMTVGWDIPFDVSHAEYIPCGQWTIIDFAPETLTLGPQRS